MTRDQAADLLHRYRREALGVPPEIGEAIDIILNALPVLDAALTSKSRQLTKCQLQRQRYHFQLGRKPPGDTPRPA